MPNVIRCGTKARFGEIKGKIGAIEIVHTNILYRFEYFDKDLNHKFIWAHEAELVFDLPEKQIIGYKTTTH